MTFHLVEPPAKQGSTDIDRDRDLRSFERQGRSGGLDTMTHGFGGVEIDALEGRQCIGVAVDPTQQPIDLSPQPIDLRHLQSDDILGAGKF
jgi:hypothetical protein